MTISEILTLMEQHKAKDDQFLFSRESGGWLPPDGPTECALVALAELEVLPGTISNARLKSTDPQKIVVLVEAFRNTDYFKALTVGEFKHFLKNVKDKNKHVCIAAPLQLNKGWYLSIINGFPCDGKERYIDPKMRDIVGGDNIFYLYI